MAPPFWSNGIASVNGTQQITQTSFILKAPVVSKLSNLEQDIDPYFLAVSFLLVGNVTLEMANVDKSWYITPGQSNMLYTGLIGCSDILDSPWRTFLYGNLTGDKLARAFDSTLPFDRSMYRNRTLIDAIHDLSRNITISYLASSLLTAQGPRIDIPTSDTRNIYSYQPLYLALSYSLAFFFTLTTALIGFHSLYLNGVSHSTSFSAIMAATRNPELDILTRGSLLGAEPLKRDAEEVRLRFGTLLDKSKGVSSGVGGETVQHVAFGLEKSVGPLRKGGAYV